MARLTSIRGGQGHGLVSSRLTALLDKTCRFGATGCPDVAIPIGIVEFIRVWDPAISIHLIRGSYRELYHIDIET